VFGQPSYPKRRGCDDRHRARPTRALRVTSP
jgi:hypothetical protein